MIDQFPAFDVVYQTYQRLMRAIKTKNVHEMSKLLDEYHPQAQSNGRGYSNPKILLPLRS